MTMSARRLTAILIVQLVLFTTMLVGPATYLRAQAPPPVHKNLIQRHPTATGVVVGVAAHHALKVSAARKKRNHQKLNWAERHPTLTAVGAGLVTRHEIKKHTPK
ncbi:MAG: hypothetical protein P4L33_10185 [Capsulimonadaceae bacterium]|nr:hypothetical protein [Capsulimonadaceae bacterium]